MGNQRITASVGIVSTVNNPSLFVAIKNKRGWDIPGGHLQKNETPAQAFKREFHEETGCSIIGNTTIIASIISRKNPNTGIIVYSGKCEVGKFIPTNEITDRRFSSREKLIEMYFGDQPLLQQLFNLANY